MAVIADPASAPAPLSTADRVSWGAHFRRFLSFVGPTWLIATTYVDPGGITGALEQGSQTRFALIWCSFWSIVVGYVFQILAARIGIVSGESLGALCVKYYSIASTRWTIWAFIEGSVFGDDIQACVGATIALNIMTGLPWWACCLLTVAVSIALTILYYLSPSKLEASIGLMMVSMIILVFVNMGYGDAPAGDVFYGWVVPKVPQGQALTVVGSVGGVLTPSALFLGSAMVLNRPVNRSCMRDIKRCIAYGTAELCIGAAVAFLVIMAVIITFANGFYSHECASQGLASVSGAWNADAQDTCGDISLGDGPQALMDVYGVAAKWIFAIVLLLSGVSSMVSATLGGQAVWEGILGKNVSFWKVVLMTRSIVFIPTMAVALTHGKNDATFTIINNWVNVFMSLSMPYAMIPALHIASSKRFMGAHALGPVSRTLCSFLVLALVAINFYLLAEFLFQPVSFGSSGEFPTSPVFYACVGAVWAIYAWALIQVVKPPEGSIEVPAAWCPRMGSVCASGGRDGDMEKGIELADSDDVLKPAVAA